MKIEKRKVTELKPYPGNPRKCDKATLEKIKKSIKEFGLVQPLVVNKNNEVIGGNQRLKALQELNINEVDVVVIDIPKKREKALNLALNKIQADWDLQSLQYFIADLDEEDIQLASIDDLIAKNIEVFEEDNEPEQDNSPKSIQYILTIPPKVYLTQKSEIIEMLEQLKNEFGIIYEIKQ
jgi:ParB-like chromosome segregation protein Spo0J